MSALIVEQSTVRHHTVYHSAAHDLSYHISETKTKNKGVQTSGPGQAKQLKSNGPKGPNVSADRLAGWME